MSKIHAEIEYEKEDGTWVHSDICPSECSSDNIEHTVADGDEVFVYRKYLHDCLDEWLDKSRGTGMFYIKDEKFEPDLYFGDDSGNFTDTERLDWLERNVFGSGYSISISQGKDQSNRNVTLKTGVGSGPWQKSNEGPDIRSAIDTAINKLTY